MQPSFVSSFTGCRLRNAPNNFDRSLAPRRQRPVAAPPARKPATCVWVERAATVLIEVNPVEAFDYYIDLEAMPEWYDTLCTNILLLALFIQFF